MSEFEKWYEENEEELLINFAESGADREMDFDLEKEIEKKYEEYLKDKYPEPEEIDTGCLE